MNKIIFFFVVIFSYQLKIFSQNKGSIIYKQINPSGKVTFFKLYFEKEKSIYFGNRSGSISKFEKINAPVSIEDTISDNQNELNNAMMSRKKIYSYFTDEEGDCIYKNFKDSTLIFRQVLSHSPLIIQEPKLPHLFWNFTLEKRKIGNFNCQKATTTFRGRKYEAWYASEISVSNGPWKLQGLPGLILEAQTEDRQYVYIFEKIEIPDKSLGMIKEPIKGEKCTLQNYQNTRNKNFQEGLSKLITTVEQRGASVSFSQDPKKIQLNNLQELNYDDLKNQ